MKTAMSQDAMLDNWIENYSQGRVFNGSPICTMPDCHFPIRARGLCTLPLPMCWWEIEELEILQKGERRPAITTSKPERTMNTRKSSVTGALPERTR